LVLDEVRNDSSGPSQDGNVHPLTSHVLAFMEGLLAYKDTMTAIASTYAEKEQSETDFFVFYIYQIYLLRHH
jgi:hypothetical protein